MRSLLSPFRVFKQAWQRETSRFENSKLPDTAAAAAAAAVALIAIGAEDDMEGNKI